MRAFRLIAVAAQAEGLLLRRQGALIGRTALLAVIAVVFGLAVILLLHIAGWLWLENREGALAACLWMALIDAAMVALLVYLARPRNDPVADEALTVRKRSLSMLGGADGQERQYDWARLALEGFGAVIERWIKR